MNKEPIAYFHIDCASNREATVSAMLGEIGARITGIDHPSHQFSVVHAEVALHALSAIPPLGLRPVLDTLKCDYV